MGLAWLKHSILPRTTRQEAMSVPRMMLTISRRTYLRLKQEG